MTDEGTSVVDRLGQTKLEDLGLKTTLKEVLNFKTQNPIELHLILFQHTNADETTEKCVTWQHKQLADAKDTLDCVRNKICYNFAWCVGQGFL